MMRILRGGEIPMKGPQPLRRGFTLIELLIVVAIIAILAAIAVPNFLEAQVRSKVSRAKADIRSLATGLEAYYVDNNHYPTSYCLTVSKLLPCGWTNPVSNYWIDGWLPRIIPLTTPVAYMTSIPEDPFFPNSIYTRYDPVNNPDVSPQRLKMFSCYSYAEDYWGYYDPNYFPLGLKSPEGADVRWVLSSLGPDYYMNYDYNQLLAAGLPTPHTPADWQARHNMTYDPTNGTVSIGDILRYGGDAGGGNGRPNTFGTTP
jgi:type II secretion system protein G